ncbi:MAG: terminase small subunit [Armatimonadota bacterium]
MAEPRLTPQQELFLSYYLGECRYNATQAAAKAGYAHANKQGSRLLQKPAVKAALDEWKAAVRQEGIACQEARIAALNEQWRRLQRVVDARAVEHQDIPGGDSGFLVRTTKLVKIYSTRVDLSNDYGCEEGDACPRCSTDGEVPKLRRMEVTDLSEKEPTPRQALCCPVCLERWRPEESEELTPTRAVELVYEYAVDTGLLRELREHKMQVAKELGQITERKEVTGAGGGPIEYKDLNDLRSLPPDELARLYFETLGVPAADRG